MRKKFYLWTRPLFDQSFVLPSCQSVTWTNARSETWSYTVAKTADYVGALEILEQRELGKEKMKRGKNLLIFSPFQKAVLSCDKKILEKYETYQEL